MTVEANDPLHYVLRLGIGGFHVKVRGQRRRQDAPSTTGDLGQEDNMHDEPSTNKRKRDRRPLKKKSILEEHMPPEMQEAFFGSDLTEKSRLMAQNHLPNAPMQLNDQIVLNTTANTNDYTIKLDHDTVNRFLIKKATKLALVVKEEQRQTPIIPVPPPLAALPPSAISAPDDENDMRKRLVSIRSTYVCSRSIDLGQRRVLQLRRIHDEQLENDARSDVAAM